MRKTVTLLVFVLLAALFAGCAKKPKVEAPTPPKTEVPGKQGENGGTSTTDNGEVRPETAKEYVTVYFDFDKYNLRDDAKAGLRTNYEIMKQKADQRIQIEGHCDERGTVEYNLALGERRARSAKEYLINLGIDAKRLSTISYGKEKPAALGANEEAWAKNRRCEFVEVR